MSGADIDTEVAGVDEPEPRVERLFPVRMAPARADG